MPKRGKKLQVVDIASADFTEEPNTKYVTSTLYDYYTDYELNGKNRDGYGEVILGCKSPHLGNLP